MPLPNEIGLFYDIQKQVIYKINNKFKMHRNIMSAV